MRGQYSKNGQALVESILLIPALAMIVFAIVWFSRVLITKQQILTAARYGTDLILYTNLDEGEIKQEIRNYLSHRWIRGRKLDPGKLQDQNIRIKIDKFSLPEFTIEDYYMPLKFVKEIGAATETLLKPLEHTSYVEIYYEYDIPGIFYLASKRNFTVSARSEVIAGTGCPGDIHK